MNTCRICYTVGDHPRYQPKEQMFGWGDVFDYFKCKECGCLQISEIPPGLKRYYPSDYYSLTIKPPAEISGLARQLNWHRLQYRLSGANAVWEMLAWRINNLSPAIAQVLPYLKPLTNTGKNLRFLDVGCGEHSEWLGALAQCGYKRLTGNDPYLLHPGKRGGICYSNAPLVTLEGEFDLISLHHSLEHIPDQHGTMLQLQRLLAPNGVCLVRIPLVDSQVWEEYGLDWVELDAPRHLYLHTKNSFAQMCATAGFSVDHILFDSTEFEFAGSAQYRVGISLTAPNSFWGNPNQDIFTEAQMQSFRAMANTANLSGKGGRAAFYLRKQDA